MCSVTERRLVRQTFRFELDPNREQLVLLAKSVGASRYVYNWGLAESRCAYELTRKRPRHSELKKRLVALKKGECPWLYEISAHIGQQALVDLEHAYDRFFKGLSGQGPKSGFPRFKKKSERDSCRVYEVELSERHLRLPKIGRVRLKERASERGFEGRILSATICRRADRWFVSLAVERDREIVLPKPVRRPSDLVGVDLGLKAAAVIHDGAGTRRVAPSQALRHNLAKLRRLDRQLARKQRGSRNREKAQLKRARLHYKISCLRNDFLHQLSSQLTKTKSMIVLEDLHVRGMQRNKHLALSISDAGMGELRRQLAYKSEWYGATLVVADRFFSSTQLCSSCGALNEQVKGYEGLKQRRFDCSACGLALDRDDNAASNLRSYGLRTTEGKQLGIVPLPEGLREVTPDGEEGSGPSVNRGETGLDEAGSESSPRKRGDPQKHVESRAGTGLKWDPSSH
jgi:putative transposase